MSRTIQMHSHTAATVNTPKTTSSGNITQTMSSLSNLTQKKSGKTSKLLEKLRKDSKLTTDDCKCRFNQGLCMFCGRSGHKAKECPKLGS